MELDLRDLRPVLERAFLTDPRATSDELARAGLGAVARQMWVDLKTGRLRENVESTVVDAR